MKKSLLSSVSLKELMPIRCCFVGGSLLIGLSLSLQLLVTNIAPDQSLSDIFPIANIVRASALVALAIFSSRIASLVFRPRLLISTSVALSLGVLAIGLLAPYTNNEAIFCIVCFLLFLVNIMFAISYLSWFELYGKMDFLHAIFYYSLVRLISGIYSSLMMSVPQSTQLGILTITPLASCLLIVRSGRLASTLPYMLGETQSGKFGIPIKPIALFTLVSFFNTFARKPIPAADRAFAVFGVVFVVGLFLIFALRYFSRLTFSSLYKISVPLFAAGALCSIMSGSYLIPGAFITNGAYALFSVFVTALLSAFSYRYGVSSLWLFGLSEAAILYGNTLADSFYDIISVGILYNWTYKLVLSILLLIYISVSLFVIPSREEDEAWGVWTSAGKRSGETTISSLTLQEKIQYVSRRYGLTKREEEVLLDMYKGKTLSEIAQCMCIAPSTMKTHTRHIYRKTGVSNRQELTDLLDSLDSRKTPQRTGSVHQ